MKKLIITMMILALPSSLFASEEQVTGAFGFKFGETYDEKKALKVEKTEQGEVFYVVSPLKPFKSFDAYVLAMTPVTKLIYAISATGLFENIRSCKQERSLIIDLLKKKYSLKDVTNDIDKIEAEVEIKRYDAIFLEQDNVAIKLGCNANGKLVVIYGDENLESMAEKERLKVESGKVDTSGL